MLSRVSLKTLCHNYLCCFCAGGGFFGLTAQVPRSLILLKIADGSKRPAALLLHSRQRRGGSLPSRKAAECEQLGKVSVELDGTNNSYQQAWGSETVPIKAEADPTAKSHWCQAQGSSGTPGEPRRPLKSQWVLQSWKSGPSPAPCEAAAAGGKDVFFLLMTSAQSHNPYPRWTALGRGATSTRTQNRMWFQQSHWQEQLLPSRSSGQKTTEGRWKSGIKSWLWRSYWPPECSYFNQLHGKDTATFHTNIIQKVMKAVTIFLMTFLFFKTTDLAKPKLLTKGFNTKLLLTFWNMFWNHHCVLWQESSAATTWVLSERRHFVMKF